MKKFYTKAIIFASVFVIGSCTQYSTSLNQMEKLQMSTMNDIKKGEACSQNIFGGFTLPYIGDTAIKLKGDESVITAIKDAKINHVYAVDRSVNNYVFYSKRCTIVFGQQSATFDPKLEAKFLESVTK